MSEFDTIPLNRNQLIEAGAGTGKTHTITNLYLRLLLGLDTGLRPLAVDEILTLTFTRAATDELRSRVRSRINRGRLAFQRGGDPEDDFLDRLARRGSDADANGKRLEAAARLMDEACIFTIHGFCSRVLSEQSFEAGSLFRRELYEQREELLRQACADCFRGTLEDLSAIEKQVFDKLWSNPEKLADDLRSWIYLEELTLTPDATALEHDPAALAKDIRECKRRWLQDGFAGQLEAAELLKRNSRPFRRLQEMTEFCRDEHDPGVYSELWSIYSRSELQGALKKDAALPQHPLIDRTDRIGARLARIREQLEVNLRHRVLEDARTRLRDVKTRRQLLTLDDLPLAMRDALRSSSPTGESGLASTLARRWPVAMVDEFQDTDGTQYEIFSRIYPPDAGGDRGLLMIGDPKQAIYQFRGADVYTYINARRDVGDRIHPLTKNWRSTPEMVEAVNRLFDKPDLFDDGGDIPFTPATPAREQRAMFIDDEKTGPFELFLVGEPDVKFNRDELTERAMAYAAGQTARLLGLSAEKRIRLDDKPDGKPDGALEAGQIAFLVKTWDEARRARRALARLNIPSVYLARESVLRQAVADDLTYILKAGLNPADDRAVRTALATRLLQCEAGEIDRLRHDDRSLRAALREFREYHEVWRKSGIAAMLNRLLRVRQLARKWLNQPDGARVLTDFRHLTELLQQGEREAPGMHRLPYWFARERQTDDGEAEQRQLRLESDENLVKIVTMHSAKGLEYDVVMIPMPVFGTNRLPDREPALYHALDGDDGGRYRACLEIGTDKACPERKRKREQAEYERTAEHIRLLYVALTRARYRCYLGLPLKNERSGRKLLSGSPFARLLEIDNSASLEGQEKFVEVPQQPPQESRGEPSIPSLEEFAEGLRARLPEELFDIVDGNDMDEAEPVSSRLREEERPLEPPPLPEIDRSRWQHSYSSLSARPRDGETEIADDAAPGFDDDDPAEDADAEALSIGVGENGSASGTGEEATFSRFSFPRGPRVGLALHKLLENLDPAAPAAERKRTGDVALDQLGLTENREEWSETLSNWLDDVLKTPLHPLSTSLARLEARDRLCEVEFHFPFENFAPAVLRLRELGYLESFSPGPDFQPAGMMTGAIDLAFRHEGRYYVLDYKSNHLGDSFEDYGEKRLQREIDRFHYDLQYLIYSVALHRWLKARSRDYDCERNLGGVFYLFLRGMRGGGTGDTGVYFRRPSTPLIEELDGLLAPGGGGMDGASGSADGATPLAPGGGGHGA